MSQSDLGLGMVVLMSQSNRPVCDTIDVLIRSVLVVGVIIGVVVVVFDFWVRFTYKLN